MLFITFTVNIFLQVPNYLCTLDHGRMLELIFTSEADDICIAKFDISPVPVNDNHPAIVG